MFNKSMWKRLKDQSGMALPMALILMIVATFIVVPNLWATGSMIKVNQALEIDTQAYYAAKSGIEDVYWRFENDEMGSRVLLNGYPLDNQVNGMDVEVKQVNGVDNGSETTYFISSTAKQGSNSLRTVYAKMTVDSTAGYPFKYAMATTGGNIVVDSNAFVHSVPTDGKADIFANGSLDINGTGRVYGEGFYTGTQEGCEKITGECEKLPAITFQTLDEKWYLEQAQLGNPWPTSEPAGWKNYILPLPTPYGSTTYEIDNGTVYLGGPGNISYINGNLDIKSGGYIIIQGVVWVNGWIISRANSHIWTDPLQPNKQFYLLVHDNVVGDHNIDIKSNTDVQANNNLSIIADNGAVGIHSNSTIGSIYAPNGKVNLDANITVKGAVLGKEIELHSNATINFPTALQSNPIEGFKLDVISATMDEFGG
jgi:hypothetical protein